MWKKVKWALAVAGVPVVLAYLGCLDDAKAPELSGPSELAQSLQLSVNPDQLTADGWSSSVIEVTYRDENGATRSGQTIQFDLGASQAVGPFGGNFGDLGNLAPLDDPRPVAGGNEAHAVSAVTDSSGTARARYWAPFRTDQANDITVTITARPAGTDFRSALYRQADIFLRAADRSIFPGGETCGISVEPQKPVYSVGEPIFFTATQLTGGSSQPIARYEWDFGDNTAGVGRNITHSYGAAASYTVTLSTTESVSGSVETCTASITVQ